MTTHTELFMLTPGLLFLTSSVFGEVVRDFPGEGGDESLSSGLPSMCRRLSKSPSPLIAGLHYDV